MSHFDHRRFYIASKLENHERVRQLRDLLVAGGWRCTYDWTTHGSVRAQEGAPADGTLPARIAGVASDELDGVMAADVVIALLPGGRGTHVELGAALAAKELAEVSGPMRIVLWSATPEEHFTFDERCSAFYHHPAVEQRGGSIEELAAWLLGRR